MTKTLTTERQQFAEQNKMSMDFVNWFFDNKKASCGNAWFLMAAAMWEGWKGLSSTHMADPVAYTEQCEIRNMQVTGLYLRGFPDNSQGRNIPLYTAPPDPVLPEEIPEVDRGEGGSDIDYMQPQEIYDMGKADGWNAYRSAMLGSRGGK